MRIYIYVSYVYICHLASVRFWQLKIYLHFQNMRFNENSSGNDENDLDYIHSVSENKRAKIESKINQLIKV